MNLWMLNKKSGVRIGVRHHNMSCGLIRQIISSTQSDMYKVVKEREERCATLKCTKESIIRKLTLINPFKKLTLIMCLSFAIETKAS